MFGVGIFLLSTWTKGKYFTFPNSGRAVLCCLKGGCKVSSGIFKCIEAVMVLTFMMLK